ncbi:MAG: peptide chain release factor N(5)-glutamine methyltransferase [Tannerellaceae bacterium]|jgi:release factor glutamine methyltransferase|nr:peptide chain release factor N(5)-glutamine methyltransferase [Tannerellaceae bacterium]
MTETIGFIKKSLEGMYTETETQCFVRMIMEGVCGLRPYQLLMGAKGKELSVIEKQAVGRAVERLRQWEPVQYVLGRTSFYGLPFMVDRRVLIPRPETEELVALIAGDHSSGREPARVLDIGTGSGCIAVALALNLPGSEVVAADLYDDVLSLAGENAVMNNAVVSFVRTDILSPARAVSDIEGTFDIIVSNPPYVMESEKADMERNVLLYEPPQALFVPDSDPLTFYHAIASLSAAKLREGGTLYLEVNSLLAKETAAALAAHGYAKIKIIQDLSGKDRIIKAMI